MARKRGNVITLSGIGRMSGGAKLALGAAIAIGAGIGGFALYRNYQHKRNLQAVGMGYLTPGEVNQALDYNTRFTQQYYARQRQLLHQRQMSRFQ
jgi:hypothetical protein